MKGGVKTDGKNPCSFYKITVYPIHFQNLSLSEPFAKKLKHELSETCYLEVPTGKIHEVALVKENNELSFKHGWAEFVERYSIGYGYFITFTYTGKSHFNVSIFSPTACEIAYHCDGGSRPRMRVRGNVSPGIELDGDNDDDDDDSDEYFDYYENPSPSSTNEQNSDDDDEITSKVTRTPPLRLPKWLIRYKNELDFVVAAGIPLPKNPFFVKRISVLCNVPKQVACRYLMSENGTVKLEMSDGKQWVVPLRRNNTFNSFSYVFGKGWLPFLKESGLQFGDVCLFELIDAKKWVIKVHVAKSS